MGSLGRSDLARAGELADLLLTVDPRQPVLPEFLSGLRDLLELDTAVSFSYRPESQALSLDWLEVAGPIPKEKAEYYTRMLAARSRRRPGLYDALCPEASQRNRVVHVDYNKARGAEQRSRRYAPLFKQLGIMSESFGHSSSFMEWADQDVFRPMGFGRHHLRALVCHDDTMLGWVGGCQDDAPTERQAMLLQHLVPALRNRLLLEESLRNAALYSAGLVALLDALGSPAFLVNHHGDVRQANAQGKAELDLDIELRDRLRKTIGQAAGAPEFVVTKVVSRGLSDHYLVRQQSGPRCPIRQIAAAGQRWALTPRQVQVLKQLAQGATNKSIAAALGISQKTIEVHVSAILRKAAATNRSELAVLVARFGTAS